MNTVVEGAATLNVDAEGIRVRVAPGRIRLEAPDLVQRQGERFVDRLLERTLSMNVVDAVAVDRGRGAITIEYDAERSGLADALDEVARALRGEAAVRAPDFRVSFDWTTVPGFVTRVDRVRKVSGEMTTPNRAGTLVASWTSRFSPSRKPSTAPMGDAAVMPQGVVVHYAPRALRSGEAVAGITVLCGAAAEPIFADEETQLARSSEAFVTSGWRRLINFVAAGGCFALSIVGFITPGIPTVPFVLATSYFLVRSTPALNERLRASRLFGQTVRDFEDGGGMRWSTKARTLGLMFGMLGITILMAGTTLPVLAMSTAVAGMDLLVVLCLPTIPEEPRRLTNDSAIPALLPA